MSARRVRALLRKELRQLFRDPKTKRIVFAAPIIQLVLLGYAVTTDVRDVSTFVVDHDANVVSRALVDALTASGYFHVVGRSDRPGDLAAALDAGRARVGVQIPPGFAADLAAGRGARVQVLIDGTHSNTATVAQGYVDRIVRSYGLAATGGAGAPTGDARRGASDVTDATDATYATYATGAAPGGSPDGFPSDAAAGVPLLGGRAGGAAGPAGGIDLRARAWFNPELASRVYNVPAVVGVLLMMMSFLLTALAVVRERELGTLDQLVVSPISPGELMLGKTIPTAIIAFVDLGLTVAVALLWFDVPFRGGALTLVIASAVYILASISAGLLISTVSRTQQEAFMTMFLVFLPLVVLSGFMYPIESMPRFFEMLTLLNPVRHFLEIVRAVFLEGAGLTDVWLQLAVIAAMAAIVLPLATWRFRKGIG